ncbi:ATP synthase subunit I [Xylophilus ampelinus]|uniref:ATP synthase protein I n=1 Tax=Xylophilus ampelinus TaxID=54067 RepID=A0A318SHR9_9BURK|nr:ATP synthase subunit I [Xylophilus ampelinus]MCS4511633.1 ATP synthase subunit I [Xylophilus ampelinus]PYE73843.1 ATP synthase protein I [Xylophilus ampelinus]
MDDELEANVPDFKPLTAEEARKLREMRPCVSPWRIVAGQAAVGVVAASAAWLLTGQARMGWSAAWGAWAVVFPAAVFARGITRRNAAVRPGAVAVGFLGWAFVKIGLAVLLLAVSLRVVPELSWLALIAGMVLAMKAYWIALLARPGSRTTDELRSKGAEG